MAKENEILHFEEYLKELDTKKAKGIIQELYEEFDVVRDFLNMKILNNRIENRVTRKYKDKIIDALYPDGGFEGGFDTEKVESLIKTIKKNPNYFYYIEIGLYAVEKCTNLADTFGGDYGAEFYEYFENLFDEILKCIESKKVKSRYKKRIKEILSKAFEGYGHKDQLNNIFEKYYNKLADT